MPLPRTLVQRAGVDAVDLHPQGFRTRTTCAHEGRIIRVPLPNALRQQVVVTRWESTDLVHEDLAPSEVSSNTLPFVLALPMHRFARYRRRPTPGLRLSSWLGILRCEEDLAQWGYDGARLNIVSPSCIMREVNPEGALRLHEVEISPRWA